MINPKEEDLYEQATKKVANKKAFISHAAAYVLTVGMLYAIMYFEGDGEMLPVIILALSWGVGLSAHYFASFGTRHLEFLGIDRDWEEEALIEEIESLKRKRALREELAYEKNLWDEQERLELRQMERTALRNDLVD